MDTLWPPIENKCFMENIFLFTGSEIQAYGYFSLCLPIFKEKTNKQKIPTKVSFVTIQKKLHYFTKLRVSWSVITPMNTGDEHCNV